MRVYDHDRAGVKVTFEIDTLINKLIKMLPGVKVVGFEEKRRLNLWNVRVETYSAPVFAKIDHTQKLRFAWLSEGKVGLLRYIEKYVKPAKLQKVRRIILAIEK
jgi:hypothetical protein